MKPAKWVSIALSVIVAVPAAAQSPVTLEDLARRVEALERENAALRQALETQTGARIGVSQPNSVAAPASAPVPVVASAPAAAAAPSSHPHAQNALWDGAYFGAGAGVSEAKYAYITPGAILEASATGPALAVQVGRRWQRGPIVLGLELEATAPFEQREFYCCFLPTNSNDLGLGGRVKAQLGAAYGPLLLYGTAGIQVSRLRAEEPHPFVEPPTQDVEDFMAPGLLLGAGAGYRVGDGWSVEIEGIVADLGLLRANREVNPTNRTLTLRVNRSLP